MSPKRRGGAPPVYTYDSRPGVPPVGVARLNREYFANAAVDGRDGAHPHVHDFLVLAYFERGGGSIWLGQRGQRVAAGDVYVIAPGDVVRLRTDRHAVADAEGWATYFTPHAVASRTPSASLSWRAHPLLSPFVRSATGGTQRLKVPRAERALWSQRFGSLNAELTTRRSGYAEAVTAHLTLLLVSVARLAANAEGDRRFADDPLMSSVFAVIEERYGDGISLRDVARAVNVSPGHLTTVVRQRTGRTVLDWITDRRMTQAQRLLVETDLAIDEIARRVGYGDASYFMRSFRRVHGITPLGWRRAGRP